MAKKAHARQAGGQDRRRMERRTRAAIAERESRGAWIGEQERCVPSPTSGPRDVFQAARDIAQQMIMVVEIMTPPGISASTAPPSPVRS